jgi:hypothetical protein
VYTAAETLFTELDQVCKSYVPWVVLGTVDVDEYIKHRITDTEDWVCNFSQSFFFFFFFLYG